MGSPGYHQQHQGRGRGALSPRVRRAWLRYLIPIAGFVVLAGAAGMAAFETDTTETY